MSVKFLFEIPSDGWENCKKNLRGYIFAAPWYYIYPSTYRKLFYVVDIWCCYRYSFVIHM